MAYVAQFCVLLAIQGGILPFGLEQKAVPLEKQQSKPQRQEVKKEQARKKAIAEIQSKNGCTKPDSKKVAAAKKAQEKFNQ